jgi:hypothetical protein
VLCALWVVVVVVAVVRGGGGRGRGAWWYVVCRVLGVLDAPGAPGAGGSRDSTRLWPMAYLAAARSQPTANNPHAAAAAAAAAGVMGFRAALTQGPRRKTPTYGVAWG